MPEGCAEHPWKQLGLAGPRESSCPLPSWEQSPGSGGCRGRTHTPKSTASPTSYGSQSPLRGSGPCLLCQQGVWLLPWQQGCPRCSAVGWGTQPGIPQPGCCLFVGAEWHGMAKMTPHLSVPQGKTARSCHLLQGLPSPAISLPLPFPLPALHREPSCHVVVPAIQRF